MKLRYNWKTGSDNSDWGEGGVESRDPRLVISGKRRTNRCDEQTLDEQVWSGRRIKRYITREILSGLLDVQNARPYTMSTCSPPL